MCTSSGILTGSSSQLPSRTTPLLRSPCLGRLRASEASATTWNMCDGGLRPQSRMKSWRAGGRVGWVSLALGAVRWHLGSRWGVSLHLVRHFEPGPCEHLRQRRPTHRPPWKLRLEDSTCARAIQDRTCSHGASGIPSCTSAHRRAPGGAGAGIRPSSCSMQYVRDEGRTNVSSMSAGHISTRTCTLCMTHTPFCVRPSSTGSRP